VNTADADFVCKAWHVPNCRTLLCTIREVWKNGERQSCVKRYFVSSLDARLVSPERFLELVQGHWQIENRLHLIKDRWWDDDRQVLFRPGLGEIWSALTDLALSLLRFFGEKKKTMPRRAMQVAQKPLTYLKMLGY
jgi:predicted transposase YbfD/YdcC